MAKVGEGTLVTCPADGEVAFPGDVECELTWGSDGELAGGAWPDDATGWITFVDPKSVVAGTPHRTSIPVTRRKGEYHGNHPTLGNVWEFEVSNGGKTLTTKPSIHAVGRWHSPNPTVWRLVERLSG